ncbi:MAG: hypothetical protein KDA28_04010 [Phycisphaerales bacterium]|nr:hypothetical protein [Phycisphaerales bacterium]
MSDIDAYFDGEMQPDERVTFIEGLKGDLTGCEDVARTSRMLAMMKESAPTPDLTSSILGEVDARRGFMTSRVRRLVRTGRLGVAASFLILALGVAVLHRVWPESASIGEPAVASSFFAAGEADAAQGVSRFSETLDQIRHEVRPIREVASVVASSGNADLLMLRMDAPSDLVNPDLACDLQSTLHGSAPACSDPRDGLRFLPGAGHTVSVRYVSVPLDRMPTSRVRVLGVALSTSIDFPVEPEVQIGGNVLHLRAGR